MDKEYIKCSFNANDYQPCEWMEKTLVDVNGHKIGISVTHNVYRWSKNKNDVVYINFCPFCGENIQPRC